MFPVAVCQLILSIKYFGDDLHARQTLRVLRAFTPRQQLASPRRFIQARLVPPHLFYLLLGNSSCHATSGRRLLNKAWGFLSERDYTLRSGLCYRKSVCRLSVVCNVRAPYSGGWNFGQYFFASLHLGHPLTFVQNFTEIVPGSRRGSKIEWLWIYRRLYLIPVSRSGISPPDEFFVNCNWK